MIRFAAVVVIVCMFVSGDGDAQVMRCIEREREALLSFKNGLIDEYGILSSWRSSDECCNWYGVVCSNSSNTAHHVITLKLVAETYRTRLRGKVGSSLLELHHLNYLVLVGNDFEGSPIPEFIGSMKQLRHLSLVFSNFSGMIPPQIGNLTNLRSLDLSDNSLGTHNLDWLSNLSLLSFLDLSESDLSHTNWLQPILSLHSLQELHLSDCNITHIVKPCANSSITSLSILDLSANHLAWSSFDWLSNISTSLVKLDLSDNSLNGPIPSTIARLIRIEHLDLFSNMLTGNLDELFRNISGKPILDTLKILDLAYNKLNGSVPHNLGTFSALTELYLGGNNLSGSMPPSLGQLSELQVLDLYNNSLEGRVSESHFIKLYSLKTLSLSFNSLIFDIAHDWSPPFQLDNIALAGCNVGPSFPAWIRTQTNFSYLDLSRAGITDEVPTWLWSASSLLERLDLSLNQISGTIPDLSSTSIALIDVSYNNFSGLIPLFKPNVYSIQLSGNMFSGSISSLCKSLQDGLWFLDLSNNQLSGEVPNCWENLSNLFFSLNLANNSFWGGIPSSLGSLHGLAALQLRGNNLSGELPSTLRFCQRLGMIDVGGNELTGEIPSWIGDIYNMRFLNFGRNRFQGSIPPGICNLTLIQILDLSNNNLSGEIPDCFHNFTVLAQTGPDLSLYDNNNYVLKNDVSHPYMSPTIYYQYSSFQWKGQEWEYRKNLEFLKLIDFSSNTLTGNIPQSFSSMMGLISLNLSRNSLTGNIIPDVGDMKMLESVDLSRNQLSGRIPASLAQLHYLAFLDLSSNNLSGRIPTSTQIQSFNTSRYAGNDGLCGDPLPKCLEDSFRPPSTTIPGEDGDIFSFMQEVGISMGFGFIFGFWGVVASFILKKSWRNAYFNLLDAVRDWFYVRTTTLFVSKWRRPS